MPEYFIPTTLGKIHATVSGTGDAMVLWPSMLTDHTLWDRQVEYFADRYTTIAIDPPGHGLSEPLTHHFDFAESARCYVEILDWLGIEWAHLVGNSWGAMTGATITARYPDRVGSAVLMNGTASVAPRRQRIKVMAQARLGRLSARLPDVVERRVSRPVVDHSVIRMFFGPTALRDQPDLTTRISELVHSHDVRSVGLAGESVVSRRPDQHILLAAITSPVLILAGREDPTFPVDEVSRMAAAIVGSEFVVIDNAAHLVAVEAPDTVNALIDDFLDRHPIER
ncbi:MULTISPECIES: alpha/beta fold hydrolase [Nocardiaceae]|uniref:Pimeloyl-ACP methyl ester carboxylesterase n=1 Tax=Rhodococcoides corynebacterioides TaxID=53972 RepID=A0ABS2KU46_9NOCA|nr:MULTISPECIES: alpha/beta fold hydrolase [Rhodococcus]MBM7415474.1 pimeloyl-ACP methyl ester carboxylesterase [Rhodococcus corynebacterioides]MBP1117936.1 pimeloyl-ACP methyl ester carboxylesterase [Rhodococcus sp. PvP016]